MEVMIYVSGIYSNICVLWNTCFDTDSDTNIDDCFL